MRFTKGLFRKAVAAQKPAKEIIGMKRADLLKGVTVRIGEQDPQIIEATMAFGANRSSVASGILEEIRRIDKAKA